MNFQGIVPIDIFFFYIFAPRDCIWRTTRKEQHAERTREHPTTSRGVKSFEQHEGMEESRSRYPATEHGGI